MTISANNYFNQVTVQNGYFSQNIHVGFMGPQGVPGQTLPRFSNLKISGHSYTDIGFPSQDQQNPSNIFYDNQDYFGHRLKEVFGISRGNYHNLGVSGNTARDGYFYTLQHENPQKEWPWIPNTGVACLVFGANDVIQGESAVMLASFKEGMRAMIARYCAAKVYAHNNIDDDGAFVLDDETNWEEMLFDQITHLTPTTHGSGEGYWQTETVGAYLTFNTPADFDTGYIHVGFVSGLYGGVANIYVDDVLTETVTTSGLYPLASTTTGRTHIVSRVAVTDGAHTIKVEVASLTTNGYIAVNYWQIEAKQKPIILVGDGIQPSNASGLWASMQVATRMQAYNDELIDLVAEWDEDTIVLVPCNDAVEGDYNTWYVNKNEQYFNGDGLHPNEWGSAVLANAFFQAAVDIISTGTDASYFNFAWDLEEDPIYKSNNPANRTWFGAGTPFTIDNFNQGFSQNGLGGSWEELGGIWGRTGGVNYGDSRFDGFIHRSAAAAPFSPGTGISTFVDNFNRADSTTTLTAPWTTHAGTFGIKNGRAYCVTASPALATVDTSIANHYVEVHHDEFGTGDGIIAKYIDASNYIKLYYGGAIPGWKIDEVVGGATNNLATGISLGSTTSIRLEVNGTNIYLVTNGSKSAAYPFNAALAAGTRVGLFATTTTAQYDDFRWGAYNSGSDHVMNLAVIDTGWSDGYISIQGGMYADNNSGFAFRVQDNLNYYTLRFFPIFGTVFFGKVVAGVYSNIGAGTLGGLAAGNTIIVQMNGSTLSCYSGDLDTLVMDETDVTFPTGTKHGIHCTRTSFSWLKTFGAFGWGENYFVPNDNDTYIDTSSGLIYGPYDSATPSWPVSGTAIGGGVGWLLDTNNLSDVASAATAFANIKQAATTTATGVVELATSPETKALASTTLVPSISDLVEVMPWSRQFSAVYPMSGSSLRSEGSGAAWTNTGTVSMITASAGIPFSAKIISAGAAGDRACSQQTNYLARRGASSTAAWGGFDFVSDLIFVDTSYDETGASTGSRIHIGLTSDTVANWFGTDYGRTAGHSVFFARESVNGGAINTNWQICTADGSAKSNADTGMVFAINTLYRFRIYCPVGGTTIYWYIWDLTNNTVQSGSTTSNLPGASTNIQPAFGVQSIDATARSLYVVGSYCSNDK